MPCNHVLKGGVHSSKSSKIRPRSAPDQIMNRPIAKSSARLQKKKLIDVIDALNAFGLVDEKKIDKNSQKPSLTRTLQTKINSLSSTFERHKEELNKALNDLNALSDILKIWDDNKYENFYDRNRKIFYSSKDKLQEDIKKKKRFNK